MFDVVGYLYNRGEDLYAEEVESLRTEVESLRTKGQALYDAHRLWREVDDGDGPLTAKLEAAIDATEIAMKAWATGFEDSDG